MSPLGFGVSLIVAFAVGVSWLAWAFDARMERSSAAGGFGRFHCR